MSSYEELFPELDVIKEEIGEYYQSGDELADYYLCDDVVKHCVSKKNIIKEIRHVLDNCPYAPHTKDHLAFEAALILLADKLDLHNNGETK